MKGPGSILWFWRSFSRRFMCQAPVRPELPSSQTSSGNCNRRWRGSTRRVPMGKRSKWPNRLSHRRWRNSGRTACRRAIRPAALALLRRRRAILPRPRANTPLPARPGELVGPGQPTCRRRAGVPRARALQTGPALPKPKPSIHARSRFGAIYMAKTMSRPGAYSGLGAINLARGDPGAALANYRKAVHRLTSRPAERVTNRSFVETRIREHRDIFIGLGRAAGGTPRQPGADERRLMDESFTAGQRAWATSAASALVKMTARLKAGDTELGRSVRHLDELNDRIQGVRYPRAW